MSLRRQRTRDDPPVAATESGGPPISPGLQDPVHEFNYEVVPGFFVQTGPEPKHIEFEDLVSLSFESELRQ